MAAAVEHPQPSFRVEVIGRFAVYENGVELADRDIASRKARTVLKVLLLSHGEPVAVERLREVLWQADPPPGAERNLASLISRLRKRLGTDAIRGGAGGYELRTSAHLEVDLAEAERLLTESRQRLTAAEPALAATAARRGLDLVGAGALLGDEPGSGWADPARATLGRLRRELRHVGWEAGLAVGDPDMALALATRALDDDPLDEEACRAVLRACLQRGDLVTGLRAFERLRDVLADDLGVDPAAATRDLHVALLREASSAGAAKRPVARARAVPLAATDLAGRSEELARLRAAWADAANASPSLLLLTGEAGIGKTRLATELAETVGATGGLVLWTRCYEAERSLFLGPVAEVVTSLSHTTPPDRLRGAATGVASSLAGFVPELGPILGPPPAEPTTPDVERRRIFDAVSVLLRRLAVHRPLLIVLDDLHQAATTTLEFLHYLARHAADGRLLVVATCRVEEGTRVLRELGEVAGRLDVGPLSDDAINDLVRRAGAKRFEDEIRIRTRGHTLAVVEILRALNEDGDGHDAQLPPVPASLRSAVLQRMERTGEQVVEFLHAAAILGSSFDLATACALLDLPDVDGARLADAAVTARLLVPEGARFAFSNDLIQQIVYDDTPLPIRVVRHARAAELSTGNAELVGWHADLAADWPRAVAAWLDAGHQAAARYANRDAEALYSRAIDAATAGGDRVELARARLSRAVVREALADFAGEFDDLEAARQFAQATGQADLEARALRELGGDVLIGLGRPSTDCLPYLEAGLGVARTSGLRDREVELLGRVAVIWSNSARFDRAGEAADEALARARELDDDRAVALALDAVKNVSAYTGDVARLEVVFPELEQLFARSTDLRLRQWRVWTVFESVIPALARASWDPALETLGRALELSRRTGHPWRSVFYAQRSWVHRARGDYGAALADATVADDREVSGGHPWWIAFAAAMRGWLLSDLGDHRAAIDHLTAGVEAAERDGMETYRVRCLSHLAVAARRAGDVATADAALGRALELLAAVRAPPGHAFLHGAHAYAAVARGLIAEGRFDDAERVLCVVRAPAERAGWHEVVATDRLLIGRARLERGDLDHAGAPLREAVTMSEAAGLVPLAWEARTVLGRIAAARDEHAASEEHAAAAASHLDVLVASLDDAAARERLRAFTAQHREHRRGEVVI
jgi:DNA-binding SARP family transcriptional activator/tetratricopeptide (TPR) repeat protein